jgi:GNAT superfamily N-acetyltransferase
MTQIRPMTADDLPFGLRLSEQAGWNQVEADWARWLDLQPDGCLVAEYENRPVGTLTTCVFGPVAWVAMVLVEASVRGRGIGRALMSRAIDDLDARGVRTIRLDATPMGRPLYESLGFVAEFTLSRFEGTPRPLGTAPTGVAAAEEGHVPAMRDLDRAVSGTDREPFLRRLLAEQPGEGRVALDAGAVSGFLLGRPGRRAWQIGPCIASPEAGPRLLADASHRLAGRPVFLDIPDDHRDAHALASSLGLTVQRPLLRMRRGEPVHGRPAWLWASSGPELG